VARCYAVSLLRLDRNFHVSAWRSVLRRNFDVTVVIAFNFCVGEKNWSSFAILCVG
jgi:hypothetical protein